MDRFEEIVASMDISIAVICSPTRVAPSLVVPIINAGIKGVLNFTSAPLSFPHGIVSENYDITKETKDVVYLQYIFTEEFFKRGYPILTE